MQNSVTSPIGYVDHIQDGQIRGWVRYSTGQGSNPELSLKAGGKVIAKTVCTLERPDLNAIGMQGKRLGFILHADFETLVSQYGDVRVEVRYAKSTHEVAFAANTVEQVEFCKARRFERNSQDKLIFIDILDMLAYLRVHLRLSGIQRVCSEIIKNLSGDRRVLFTSTCGKSCVYVHRTSDLLAIIDYAADPFSNRSAMTAKVDACYLSSSIVVPDRGDIYFVAGAFWVDPKIALVLASLRRRGVLTGVMIYDLIAFSSPNFVTRETLSAMQVRAASTFPFCCLFVAISEFVKREFTLLSRMEMLSGLAVEAVPLPRASDVFGPSTHITTNEREKYVLFVSTIESRKNHMLLYSIWAALLRKYGPSRVPRLVLVGRWGWGVCDFKSALENSNYLGGKVVVLDDLSDLELNKLYRGSLFTVYPSYAEGWGIPIGESLAAGKTCVCSDTTSMSEVGGDLVEYIHPNDYVNSLATVERIIFDDEYRMRREADIAEKFLEPGWKDYAARLLSALEASSARVAVHGLVFLRPGMVHRLGHMAEGHFDLVNWSVAGIAGVLVDGWEPLEHWGSWSSNPRALISFKTKVSTSKARIGLEVRSPVNAKGMSVSLRAGDVSKIIQIGSKPAWAYIDVPANSSFESVFVEIVADPLGGLDEQSRQIFVGLSSIAVFEYSEIEV